jgi:hypothetical protein
MFDMTHRLALETHLLQLREAGFVENEAGDNTIYLQRGALFLMVESGSDSWAGSLYNLSTIPPIYWLARASWPTMCLEISDLMIMVDLYVKRILAGDGEAWEKMKKEEESNAV